MLKKLLALTLVFTPICAFAQLPAGSTFNGAQYLVGSGVPGVAPSAAVGGGNCWISASGVLTCGGDPGSATATFPTDLINPGNVAPGAPGLYGDISYAGWGGTVANSFNDAFGPVTSVNLSGNIKNEGFLNLAPGSGPMINQADGTIYVGGYVYNGTLDGATYDDTPTTGAVARSRLLLEGGSVTINGHDANNVAILNTGEHAIEGNLIVTSIDPSCGAGGLCFAHSTVTSADSLSVQANSGAVVINGAVWNNTANGTAARVTGTNANNVRLGVSAAQAITVNGNVVNYGAWSNFTAGTALNITGNVTSGHGTVALVANNGALSAGNITLDGDAASINVKQTYSGGVTLGAINISSGYGTFESDSFMTINGDINTSGAGYVTGNSFLVESGAFASGNITNSAAVGNFSVTATNGIAAGNITNSAGLMYLNAGTSAPRSLIATSITSGTGGTVVLDYVGNIALSGTTTALNIAGGLFVGQTTAVNGGNGDLYITANSGVYNAVTGLFETRITAKGAVNVAGDVAIANGRGLRIGAAAGNYIDVALGNINNGGGLFVGDAPSTVPASGYGVRSFAAGNIDSNGTSLAVPASLYIYVANDGTTTNNITAGVVQNGAYSDAFLYADDNIAMDSFTNMQQTSGDATIWAKNGDILFGGGINSGFLENMAVGSSQMIVRADNGSITAINDIENSGTFMQLLAPDGITVGGTMKNDWLGGLGTLLIGTDGVYDSHGNLGNANAVAFLTINGGDAANASLVNTGTFKAVVTGETYLEYGTDLTTIPDNGTFYLDTGTLVLGNAAASPNGLNDMMANRIDNFTLKIQNGDITAPDIINGAKALPTWNGTAYDYSAPGILANASANMYVSAQNITATSVNNIGDTLNLISDSTAAPSGGAHGNLWIKTNVMNGTADGAHPINNGQLAATNLQAAGILAVDGTVNNFANLSVNGQLQVILNSVINAGKMSITSLTNVGEVDITGAVINNGPTATPIASEWATGSAYDLFVNAKAINITGNWFQNSGTALIKASDANAVQVNMAGINVTGGQLDIDALLGVALSGGITTTGGLLNFSQNTNFITAAGNISIAGNLNSQSNTYDTTAGSVNILSGNEIISSANGNIYVDGNILAAGTGTPRNLTLLSLSDIVVGGNATATGNGVLSFGNSGNILNNLTVGGQMLSDTGAKIVLWADNATVGTLLVNGKVEAHGLGLTANSANGGNAININNGIWMDGTNPTTGFVIGNEVTNYALQTTGAGGNINVTGGISVAGAGKILSMSSANRLLVAGNVNNAGAALNMNAIADVLIAGNITSASNTNITGNGVFGQNITNSGNFNVTSTGGNIQFANITNNAGALMTLGSAGYTAVNVATTSVTQNAGVLNVYGANWTNSGALNVFNNAMVNLYASHLNAGNVYLNNDLVQDLAANNPAGSMNVLTNNAVVNAAMLTVNGNLLANAQAATYNGTNGVSIGEKVVVASGATVNLSSAGGDLIVAGTNVSAGMESVSNHGTLTMTTNSPTGALAVANGITNYAAANATINGKDVNLGHVQNYGTMSINSGTTNMLQTAGLESYSGGLTLAGMGAKSSAAWNIAGQLTQNMVGSATLGGANILSGNYVLDLTNGGQSPASLTVGGGIIQESGNLLIKTASLIVSSGGILASPDGITIAGGTPCFGNGCTPPAGVSGGNWFPWLSADINGGISDGVRFIGLGDMTVNGDYNFGDHSMLQANILPKNFDPSYNHFGTVSTANDATFGSITMPAGSSPVISVSGVFASDLGPSPTLPLGGAPITNGQMGISLFNSVDTGTAIWLVHAEDGVEQSGMPLRNVTVAYCNADGTKCFNYLDAIRLANGSLYSKSPLAGSDDPADLPIYLTLRPGTGVGDNPHDIYIVFDPEFGGPINVYRIQPIVNRDPAHTTKEYVSAGALDDFIDGGLARNGFAYNSPIETIPFIFNGTNFGAMANQLYNRMEQYKLDFNPAPLSRFSRLFIPRELELAAGDVNLLEHTNPRDFAHRMLDEFLWNRNRNLNKVWADVEYGVFNQTLNDPETARGTKLTLNLGIDSRLTNSTIYGLALRINRLSSSFDDTIDLSYGANTGLIGNVRADVTNTNIGLGAYLLTTYSRGLKLYGNLFLDMHKLDVTRDQTYMGQISGSGTAYSATSELGLMHDILNQYLYGNAYARVGYNTGFDIATTAAGANYMTLKSDGYFSLTPGYSVTLNKRFYMSPWSQIRPFVTLGVEYDVLGMNSDAYYAFAPAMKLTNYELNVDPLWATGKLGVEFIAVSGFQAGLDYEYRYNADIQLHNFRISGSYRF
ncbi:MAG: hypothetical protein FWC61_02375 [Proteobacteria bacterium]|nr:hypothetical protein [Pseudomonadota bacterium]